MSDTERLQESYYGLSLKTSASLKVHSVGLSNVLVLIGLIFMALEVVEGLVRWFYFRNMCEEDVESKVNFWLDLSRHIKTD